MSGLRRVTIVGMTTTIRITDPVDLVKVVPYQLGYHPEHSLVLIGLCRKQIGLVQRLDLPTLPQDCAAAAQLMVAHLRADGCTAAVLVVYEQTDGEGDAAAAAVASRLRHDRVELVEHVVVRGEQAFFPELAGHGARPAGGVLLPPDDHVPAVADYVAHGRRPAASREALDARIAAHDDPLRERVRVAAMRLGALRPVQGSRGKAMADWGAFLDVGDEAWFAGRTPSAAAVARMCHSLRDLHLRDLITAWLCPGTLELDAFSADLVDLAHAHLPADRAWPNALSPQGSCDGVDPMSTGGAGAGARQTKPGKRLNSRTRRAGRAERAWRTEQDDRLVERLCWLARHAPDMHAPGVLAVLASFTWYLGDGTLTRLALDRALTLDPGYRLALLVERMVDLAIRPGQQLTGAG